MTEKKLHISIGSVTTDWETKEKLAGNWYTGISIETTNLDNVLKAMELLGIEVFIVSEGESSLSANEIYISPLVSKTRQIEKSKKDEYDQQMKTLCKELNSLPRIVKTWYFGAAIKVVLVRPEKSEYNPTRSSKLLGSFGIEIYIGEKQVDDNFWLTDYITEDGKIQKKKFYENLRRHGLEDYAKTDFKGIEEFVNSLKEIKEVKDQCRSKYRIH